MYRTVFCKLGNLCCKLRNIDIELCQHSVLRILPIDCIVLVFHFIIIGTLNFPQKQILLISQCAQ
jgi:hypothetical protein